MRLKRSRCNGGPGDADACRTTVLFRQRRAERATQMRLEKEEKNMPSASRWRTALRPFNATEQRLRPPWARIPRRHQQQPRRRADHARRKRDFMESRFGRDFSDVRIHSDNTPRISAMRSARAIHNRQRYLFQQRPVFPRFHIRQAAAGDELTHVVQQNGSLQRKVIQRYPWPYRLRMRRSERIADSRPFSTRPPPCRRTVLYLGCAFHHRPRRHLRQGVPHHAP